jgi:sec-independent protein translocase protein TatC
VFCGLVERQSFDQHLDELRDRLKIVSVFFVLSAAGGFLFSKIILQWLQTDLGVGLNALVAYEVLYTQLLVSLLIGGVVAVPLLFYQLLRFSRPGLKEEEYLLLRNYLPFSVLLFGVGSVFAYEFVVKSALQFFQASTQASSVEAVWGLRSTIGFALRLSALTGVLFQLPIVSVVLAKAGLLNSGMMRQYRSHFIITVLIISAAATPPDILTQLLVTIPVIGLYQLSTWLVAKIT